MPAARPPQIPNKLSFRIGDVSELVRVEPYVLRFWESEFPMLQPRKGKSGQREYKRKDVELLLEIKRLLYDQGFTIPGARKALQERQRPSKNPPRQQHRQQRLKLAATTRSRRQAFTALKRELREILAILRRRK